MVLSSEIILAVGAHPDDIELGCGGTVYKAVQKGKRVIAVYMTKGEKSGEADVRVKETLKALGVLGVTEVFFESFPDTQIPDSFDAIESLEKYATRFKPDLVLTHSINDTHQDHRRMGWIVMSAFRNVPRVLAFETPRVRPAAFMPTYFVDIQGCIEKKLKALECHISQKSKRYLAYEATVTLSSFRGSQVGVKEAEAFEVVKYVET